MQVQAWNTVAAAYGVTTNKTRCIKALLPPDSLHRIPHIKRASQCHLKTLVPKNRQLKASVVLMNLVVPNVLTPEHLFCLRNQWYEGTRWHVLNLWHQHYASLIRDWTKYEPQQTQSRVNINSNFYIHKLLTEQQYLYTFNVLLAKQLPANFLSLICYELINGKLNQATKTICTLLSNSTPRQQRHLFLMYVKLIWTLCTRPALKWKIAGMRATLKGKIGRTGSARKQKLCWQAGKLNRAQMNYPVQMRTSQATTRTGTLGISLQFSYKFMLPSSSTPKVTAPILHAMDTIHTDELPYKNVRPLHLSFYSFYNNPRHNIFYQPPAISAALLKKTLAWGTHEREILNYYASASAPRPKFWCTLQFKPDCYLLANQFKLKSRHIFFPPANLTFKRNSRLIVGQARKHVQHLHGIKPRARYITSYARAIASRSRPVSHIQQNVHNPTSWMRVYRNTTPINNLVLKSKLYKKADSPLCLPLSVSLYYNLIHHNDRRELQRDAWQNRVAKHTRKHRRGPYVLPRKTNGRVYYHIANAFDVPRQVEGDYMTLSFIPLTARMHKFSNWYGSLLYSYWNFMHLYNWKFFY